MLKRARDEEEDGGLGGGGSGEGCAREGGEAVSRPSVPKGSRCSNANKAARIQFYNYHDKVIAIVKITITRINIERVRERGRHGGKEGEGWGERERETRATEK